MREEKRLGLAYHTKHFNISPKKRLKDPLQLFYGGELVCLHVNKWIDKDAEAIFNALYINNHGLELARDSIAYLKTKLRQDFPHLLEIIERRKIERAVVRR